jgi:hypothetical protein
VDGINLQSSSNLEIGKRGSVSVRLEANPKPNVTWTLGGKEINMDGIRYMTTVVQEWEVKRIFIFAETNFMHLGTADDLEN